jgi:hypothetical protein
LIFNLALSHHTIVLHEAIKAPSSDVANAIFLYQLAYVLQRNGGIELSSFHTLGMINNVGKLLALVGSMEESRNCFEHLLQQCMVQVVDKREASTTVPEENQQLEGFLDNISHMVLKQHSSETSPAA